MAVTVTAQTKDGKTVEFSMSSNNGKDVVVCMRCSGATLQLILPSEMSPNYGISVVAQLRIRVPQLSNSVLTHLTVVKLKELCPSLTVNEITGALVEDKEKGGKDK